MCCVAQGREPYAHEHSHRPTSEHETKAQFSKRDLPRRSGIALEKELVRLERRLAIQLAQRVAALSTCGNLRVCFQEKVDLGQEPDGDVAPIQICAQALVVATGSESTKLVTVNKCTEPEQRSLPWAWPHAPSDAQVHADAAAVAPPSAMG